MENSFKRKRSPSPSTRPLVNDPSYSIAPSTSRNSNIHLQPNGLANPSRAIFDPWNSVATGHQRAENSLSGSTSWRHSRNVKLSKQYRSGRGGGERVYDIVGAGSKDFGNDGRKLNGSGEKGASGLRTSGQMSIMESFDSRNGRRDTPMSEENTDEAQKATDTLDDDSLDTHDELEKEKPKQIFQNLCFYVNGSTAPLISDHKLKYLLAEHGASTSIGLGRRTVTHVIVGNSRSNGGAGGGLAGGKIQNEIARVGGKGVKFVNVEWVVECIKAGKRLPEAPYADIKLAAPSGQRSVLGMFKSAKPGQSGKEKEKG